MKSISSIGSIGSLSGFGGDNWYDQPLYADAAAIADFTNDRYAITSVPLGSVAGASAAQLRAKQACTFNDIFAFVSSGTVSRTYTDINGILRNDLAVDQPRFDYSLGTRFLALSAGSTQNVFLNSAVGVTQNISVTAQAYVLSFTGTGTIARSGVSTGSLVGASENSRVQATFTPTAGSLTLTVTGDVRLVQLEAGNVATDYIPTTSVAVTRPVETAEFSLKIEAIAQRSSFGFAVRGRNLLKGAARAIGAVSSGPVIRSSSNRLQALTEPTQLTTASGSDMRTNPWALAAGFDGSGRSIVRDGVAVASDNVATALDRTNVYLGRDQTSAATVYGDARYGLVLVYPERPSNARLLELVA